MRRLLISFAILLATAVGISFLSGCSGASNGSALPVPVATACGYMPQDCGKN